MTDSSRFCPVCKLDDSSNVVTIASAVEGREDIIWCPWRQRSSTVGSDLSIMLPQHNLAFAGPSTLVLSPRFSLIWIASVGSSSVKMFDRGKTHAQAAAKQGSVGRAHCYALVCQFRFSQSSCWHRPTFTKSMLVLLLVSVSVFVSHSTPHFV